VCRPKSSSWRMDAAVFVIQQGALDIGGMGLLKLAKRAGLPKDSFPVRLGASLVVLMILNVALASVKHTLPMIPDGVFVGIETLLLIARAIVAVLFGHAIHALREEYGESTMTVKEASELQQRMDTYDEQLQQVQTEVQQRVREVQGSVSTLVQSVVQTQTHAILSELQAVQARLDKAVQSQFTEVYALVQSLTPPRSEQAQEQGQEHETASEQGQEQPQRGQDGRPIRPLRLSIQPPPKWRVNRPVDRGVNPLNSVSNATFLNSVDRGVNHRLLRSWTGVHAQRGQPSGTVVNWVKVLSLVKEELLASREAHRYRWVTCQKECMSSKAATQARGEHHAVSRATHH
jgi:hypothetical protein